MISDPARRKRLEMLAPLGWLVAYGNASGGTEAELPSGARRTARSSASASRRSRPRVPGMVRELSRRAFELLESGAVEVTVTREFPLEDAGAAHELLGSGQSTGKLVLQVGGSER